MTLPCECKKAGNPWNPRKNPKLQGRQCVFHGNRSWSWCSGATRTWLRNPRDHPQSRICLRTHQIKSWMRKCAIQCCPTHNNCCENLWQRFFCLEFFHNNSLVYSAYECLIVHWRYSRTIHWAPKEPLEPHTIQSLLDIAFLLNNLSSSVISFWKKLRMCVTFACLHCNYLEHFGTKPIAPWVSVCMKIPTVGVLSNAEVAQYPRNALLLDKRELKYIWTPSSRASGCRGRRQLAGRN